MASHDLSPSSAPAAASSLAAELPTDVLEAIFSFCIDIPVGVRPFGGYLESWYSNETMRACNNVLYHSISLADRDTTNLLLRTLANDPRRADKVNYLALRLVEEGLQIAAGAARLLEDSLALLEAVKLCRKTITHLHLYPLHKGARTALFEVIPTVEALETLVCSPRFYDPFEEPHVGGPLGGPPFPVQPAHPGGAFGSWAADLYSRTDLYELVLPPCLHTLELDFASSWSAQSLPFLNGLHPRGLKKLRLRCDTDEEVLWEVLKKCPELEVCELYFERLLSRDDTTAALRASTSTMRQMQFLCNPTFEDLALFDSAAEPIFDRLLPSYTRLETLAISATELSSSVFRLLPPSVEALEIQAFNHVSTFRFTPGLAADIRDSRYATGLKSLRVHDAAEAWEEEHIQALEEACEARGIVFYFRADTEAGSV
ncbi:hypothetical protein JCM10213v2_001559 [Rhodosporidiobolus nylandii]